MRALMYLGVGICLATMGLTGCASHDGEDQAEPSLEEALASVPSDFEGRLAALDAIAERHGKDPRVLEALRKLSSDTTPGLLKRVDKADGRWVAFVGEEGGSIVIAEGGPESLRSLTSELGLERASPAMLWEALVAEPVPQALVAVSTDPGSVVDSAVEASTGELEAAATGPEGYPEGTVLGSPGRYVPPASNGSGDLGTTREAFNFTGDQFILVGGCAIAPSPGAASYANQVSGSPFCMPNASGDFTRILQSKNMRTHVHLKTGGAILLQLTNAGSVTANFAMTAGDYVKTWSFDPPHCERRCCGWPIKCTSHCTTCGIIDSEFHGAHVLQSTGDLYHFGGTWYTKHDDRTDTTPWL